MTGFPVAQLGQWPGRFRSAGLVRALAAPRPVDPDLAAAAILAGLVDDHDELQVFGSLLETGEFEAAEWMLSQCPVFDDETERGLALRRLNEAQVRSREGITARLGELTQRADSAGLPVDAVQAVLEELSLTSRPDAEERLDALERELADGIEAKASSLRARLGAAEDFDAGYTEAIEALIDAGDLRAAERTLDGTEIEQVPGPQGVRRLPALEWTAPAEDILRWHLEGSGGPASFRPASEPEARDLLAAYNALRHGGADNAKAFARALDDFLGDEKVGTYRVNQEKRGYLTGVHNALHDQQIMRFRRRRVPLYIAEPGVTEIPEDLLDQPLIAIGPSLTRPGPRRGAAALVTLDDLLRLVLIKNRRPVALLRILGRQWPVRALAGETAEELERLLGETDQERWLTLSWLVDLCGLGDTTVTDAIASETGLDAALVRVFLDYLDRRQDPGLPDSGVMRHAVRGWHADKRMSADVERAIVDGLRSTQDAVMAFWAALTAAPVGREVTMLELAMAAEEAAPARRGSDGEIPVNWEEEMAAGAAELGRSWLGSPGDGALTLRECGACNRLAVNAEDRLKRACEIRVEQLRQASRKSRRDLKGLVLGARQHALHRLRDELERASQDPGATEGELAAKRRALEDELASTLDDDGMTGSCDLGTVLGALKDGFQDAYGNLSIALEGTPEVSVAVGRVLMRAILLELFLNAAEALTELGGGMIGVEVEVRSDDEILVRIRDDGDGIPPAVRHRIFKDGISTRGSNRGYGLFHARRMAQEVDVALELAPPGDADPQFPGAHFMLSLPRRSGP